ncbi:MAG: D-ribitol-5-phosphate cytidylyltransferase [Bifidobacteriaceae bacterium]|jgi:2-C-methyl-D-erythritol 4-phosphate cytidylyltransferase|nr:D-ribitol-5-phosphate cytidylyltransferase [Bifidobacteriaceae bacterium]
MTEVEKMSNAKYGESAHVSANTNASNSAKSYFCILAGGSGTRLKTAKLPKQFIELSGVPIIIRTIRGALTFDVDEIIVAINPAYREFFVELLAKFEVVTDKIATVDGGGERIDSIYNAVGYITATNEHIHSDSVILIHDAVRPFVKKSVVAECIENARKFGASITGVPAYDTMVYSENGETVESIPLRSALFHAQTPDAVRLPEFIKTLQSLTADEKETLTGTVHLSMRAGLKVAIAKSDSSNMKITTDSDLAVADGILQSLENGGANEAVGAESEGK